MSKKCLLKAAAKEAGKTRYVSSSPCLKGHGLERLVVNGACVECAREKRRKLYYRNPQQRIQAKESMRIRRAKDPVGVKMKQSRGKLMAAYGLTQGSYEELFAKQNGCCAICGNRIISRFDKMQPLWTGAGAPKNEVGRVDHCHLTNVIRGLLCSNCNIGLGKFRDSQRVLLQAVRYLRENATVQAQPDAERKSVSEIEPAMGPQVEQRRGNRRDGLSPFL